MSFSNWLQKLDKHKREELLYDILDGMSDTEKASVLDEISEELHENGYDFNAGDESDSKTRVSQALTNELPCGFNAPNRKPNNTSSGGSGRSAAMALNNCFDSVLMKHHGLSAYEAHDQMLDMGY